MADKSQITMLRTPPEAEIRENDPEWGKTIWVCHRCDSMGFPPPMPTLCDDDAMCPMKELIEKYIQG